MDITFTAAASEAQALILPVFDDAEALTLTPAGTALDAQVAGRLRAAAAAQRFKAGLGRTLEVVALGAGEDGGGVPERVMLLGLGEKDALTPARLERAGAAAARAWAVSGVTRAQLRLDGLDLADGEAEAAARAALGARLGAYRFDLYRTTLSDDKKPTLTAIDIVVTDPDAAAARWVRYGAVADGVALARDLVSEPANILHPEAFARRMRGLSDLGLAIDVLGEAEMQRLGMGSLLGVGRGSRRESQLVVLEWRGGASEEPPLLFVGKGVTFDTGGISLKPGPGMEEMKGDMGGAAAVAGVMRALAQRRAAVNVVGVLGLVENMPDGDAQRPGDIVTSLSGQTIEVLNTDAEGRLVLADAIWYAEDRFKPKLIVDLATLTGAMVIALAHEYAGVFASDDALAEALIAAGREAEEPVWRMPLGEAYDKMLDSKVADMKNIGGREGGSITAAQFIKRFVRDAPWAHLDIAPTAWKSKSDDPREPTWATGWGVRILERFVADAHEGGASGNDADAAG